MSRCEVEYYESVTNRCPVQDLLNSLEVKERKRLIRGINLLNQYGSELVLLGRDHAAHLRDKIFELRVRTRHKRFRVFYFFFDRDKAILTHGVVKKTGRVPDSEIERAIAYRQDYFRRHT
jgi:phage-related protein